jgi:hypothetical protein
MSRIASAETSLDRLIPKQHKSDEENLAHVLLATLYKNFLLDYNSVEKKIIQLELDNLYEPIMKPELVLTTERMLDIYYALMYTRIFDPATDKHLTELIPSISMAEFDKFSSRFSTFSAEHHDELSNVIRMVTLASTKENKLKKDVTED